MGHPKEEENTKQVLIIGGGIAGLSTGIYARQNGYPCTILEMDDHPGGQLTAWTRQSYTFDFCLHWLVGSKDGQFHEIYRELGAIDENTTVIDHDVFLKMVNEEQGDFIFYTDMNQWESYLKEIAPENSKGIHKLCNMIKRASRMKDAFENPPDMRSFWEYFRLVAKNPGFILFIMAKYSQRRGEELLDDLKIKNQKLRYFLIKFCSSDQPGHDWPALVLIVVLAFQHAKNAGYLKDGSKQMSQRIAETYERLGGEFKFNARVKEILVEDNVARGVMLESGEEILADHIISACDGHTTLYEMLGGKYVPPAFEKAYKEWPTFTPWVMIGFGIDKTIISDASDTEYDGKIQIGRTSATSYAIMNRSMYDETFAPEGKTALQMYFESPWDIWKDMSDTEYSEEKKVIEKRCVELLEMHYPGILEHIEVINLATPRTETRFTGVWKGSFEGFEPAVGKFGAELPLELEGLNNFSMAGQWIRPGGGLPPSAQSGRWAIQKLCREDKKRFKHYVPA